MTTPDLLSLTVDSLDPAGSFDEAELAAAAFLARYSGRTLDAYRHDLRAFFQWATDVRLAVLDATRPHIELYRTALEARGLAASTIDRRLSTVCGFYRFAHIDGRIASNPAQYARRPRVHPSQGRGLDRSELGTFLFTAERFDRDHAGTVALRANRTILHCQGRALRCVNRVTAAYLGRSKPPISDPAPDRQAPRRLNATVPVDVVANLSAPA